MSTQTSSDELEPFPRGVCVFCGRWHRRLTQEHALPNWVDDVLLGSGDFTVTLHNTEGATVWSRSAPAIDQVIGRVCYSCNHGWMGALEGQCKPVLAPLIRFENPPRSLSLTDQRNVAFWSVKTALMLEFVHGGRRVPKGHYRWVYDHALARVPPPGGFVWLSAYSMERFTVWSKPEELILQGPISGRKLGGYLASFSVGHLVVQVGYFGSSEGVNPEATDLALQIWPIITQRPAWPLGGFVLTQVALEAFGRRFISA